MRVYHRVTSTAGSIKPRRRGWDFQLRERARECAVLVRGAVLCERACVPCIVFIFIVVFVRPAYKIWARRRRRRGTRIIPASGPAAQLDPVPGHWGSSNVQTP